MFWNNVISIDNAIYVSKGESVALLADKVAAVVAVFCDAMLCDDGW